MHVVSSLCCLAPWKRFFFLFVLDYNGDYCLRVSIWKVISMETVMVTVNKLNSPFFFLLGGGVVFWSMVFLGIFFTPKCV